MRCPLPVRELIIGIPAPRGDHCENEPPAVVEQLLIDVRIARADHFGNMSKVELDRSSATRLEIYEDQAVTRTEQVAWVRLAVDQLLDRTSIGDRSSQGLQRANQEVSVRLGEPRCAVGADKEFFGFRDTVREVRAPDTESPHAGVESSEHVRVVAW